MKSFKHFFKYISLSENKSNKTTKTKKDKSNNSQMLDNVNDTANTATTDDNTNKGIKFEGICLTEFEKLLTKYNYPVVKDETVGKGKNTTKSDIYFKFGDKQGFIECKESYTNAKLANPTFIIADGKIKLGKNYGKRVNTLYQKFIDEHFNNIENSYLKTYLTDLLDYYNKHKNKDSANIDSINRIKISTRKQDTNIPLDILEAFIKSRDEKKLNKYITAENSSIFDEDPTKLIKAWWNMKNVKYVQCADNFYIVESKSNDILNLNSVNNKPRKIPLFPIAKKFRFSINLLVSNNRVYINTEFKFADENYKKSDWTIIKGKDTNKKQLKLPEFNSIKQ